MKPIILLATIVFFSIATQGQSIKRIDGSKIAIDSLHARIHYLMKAAKVSGAAITVFNDNKPVFS